MVIEIGNYIIDADVAATREYYASDRINDCACDGCENYREYIRRYCDSAVTDFFSGVGIDDMRCISEIMPFNTLNDGKVLYGGFYHICGRLLKCPAERELVTLAECFDISIEDKCDLLAADFPKPAIQIEISSNIPWVIDRPNTY